MIKTFRGQLADGGQEVIRLSTNNGMMGYKIKKLELISVTPGGGGDMESIVQVFTTERTAAIPTTGATVDMNDPTLLAVAYLQDGTAASALSTLDVIIDNVKFNQDIFITHTNNASDISINFYVELEQMKLDINEATVATLKDMRGRE
jgi:hypothetical protein|tara:strand:- start:185 stop:628 length:444 start_codon:yes stop_codon:yes gene_type:complete